MKLKMIKRSAEKKSEIARQRRAGMIPAIIYVQGRAAEKIAVPTPEFSAQLRKVQPGHLSTTIFALVDEHGKERRVIIKEIQYKVTTYDVMHLDFEELHDNVKVSLKVPIECTGVADCTGVKLGGSLRQVLRYMRVRCLPRYIPKAFELDVRSLGLNESYRLSDIALDEHVTPLTNLNTVAVLVATGKAKA